MKIVPNFNKVRIFLKISKEGIDEMNRIAANDCKYKAIYSTKID